MERARLATFRTPKRREEWLLGRLGAKRLVRAWAREVHGLEIPLDAILVGRAARGTPEISFEVPDGPPPPALSLSHRAGHVLVALCDEPGVEVGADVEVVEPRSDAFVREWFTDAEQAALAGAADRDLAVVATWSAKEAALKVLGLGLSVDTRGVEVRFGDPAGSRAIAPWSPFTATCGPFPRIGDRGPFPAGTRVAGWWWRAGGLVLVLAGGTPPLARVPPPTTGA